LPAGIISERPDAENAAEQLSAIGQKAVAPLIEVLESESEYASAAATYLGSIQDPAAVPELLEALSHQKVAIRVAAAKALGSIRWRPSRDLPGVPAPDLISAFVDALSDSAPPVRSEAEIALRKIGGQRKNRNSTADHE
jgi:HEAT repeat protein